MLVETALTEVEATSEALIGWLLNDELNEDVVTAIEIVRAEYE